MIGKIEKIKLQESVSFEKARNDGSHGVTLRKCITEVQFLLLFELSTLQEIEIY